ncbi:MAG TPA: hypothetical protein DDX85_14495 [Nitrospiraceae bacterium]|nr:hypothetical protein [Nitrospiraceae bacterium]
MTEIISGEVVESRILLIRGKKVMIDRDLARLYEVETKALNQAVKRNLARFPEDFMFQLSESEKNELVTNCDRFSTIKHSSANPYAFTEQGVAMLSSVLKSERAVLVNIAIMRTFVKLREILSTHKDLANKLALIEKRIDEQDDKIHSVFEAIRALMEPPKSKKKQIGFKRETEKE